MNWNIDNLTALDMINKNIDYLFFINNKMRLPIQYILMNLNKIIKTEEKIILKYNNKVRNINNYIKIIYGGFENLIKNYFSKNYKIDDRFLIIL